VTDLRRSPTSAERTLLIEIACYFSERAVEQRGLDDRKAQIFDEVAGIIGHWKPELEGVQVFNLNELSPADLHDVIKKAVGD
jgi:hypothetical protein